MTYPLPARRRLLAAALFSLAAHALPGHAATARIAYPARAEVREFIDMLVERHGFERARLERWLDAARYSSRVEQLMQPPLPFGQRNWLDYRARNLEPARIDDGVQFWRSHAAVLDRARQIFGVPPEIVVAIIGIETHYGRVTGNFRTIDVLATLSFDYLRRAEYYRQELVEFLLLAREQKFDPLQIRGSYAGAIGLPQFMPRSIRSYAVDFDGDGRIDLLGSPADAIGSVANFLLAHGWQPRLPVLFDAAADEAIVDALGRGILARAPWYEALAAGVVADLPIDLATPVLVIDLPYITPAGAAARMYRVGTANFSAILHYNRSYFYATAVVELSRALAAAN
jgi:membrane-bound lytic murein transglycosylase B